MCGRYVSRTDPDGIARLFVVDERHVDEHPPSYNVAPTDPVLAVVEHHDRRHLVQMRWGLVPHWAEDVRIGARMINARAESAADKPAFRDALARRRCLLPADGFYEWERRDGRRLPWFVHRADERPLALAGLWAVWRDPSEEGSEPLRTCAILTTDAGPTVEPLHDRMPLVIAEHDWARWLDRDLDDAAAVQDLLTSREPDDLVRHRVSTDVNSVRNNTPDLLEPVAA